MANKYWVRLSTGSIGLDARTLNNTIKEVVGHKVGSIAKDGDFRKKLGRMYIDLSTPYVPKKTGVLRDSGYAFSDGRVGWDTNYAQVQYYTLFNNYTTSGTGPYWDQQADTGELVEALIPEIIRRFK